MGKFYIYISTYMGWISGMSSDDPMPEIYWSGLLHNLPLSCIPRIQVNKWPSFQQLGRIIIEIDAPRRQSWYHTKSLTALHRPTLLCLLSNKIKLCLWLLSIFYHARAKFGLRDGRVAWMKAAGLLAGWWYGLIAMMRRVYVWWWLYVIWS